MTGAANTATGHQALYSNISGNFNTASGQEALFFNTTGSNNTASGYLALYYNNITLTAGSFVIGTSYVIATLGTTNFTLIGAASNTVGVAFTATGVGSGTGTATANGGNNNSAIGFQALHYNTTGSNNTASGYQALHHNTTGNNNTASGLQALFYNESGSNNVATGLNALLSNTGSNNTAIGQAALQNNTLGNFNTAVGQEAGYGTGANANTIGSNNTFIGYDSEGASAAASNVITLGNGSITTLRCQVTSITALSDRRDKKDIQPLPTTLQFVNALKPVSFTWNTRDGKKVDVPEMGFIAQDLQETQAAYFTVPNLVSDVNPDKLEASPGTLIPVLVKAIQEQQALINQLTERIARLENKGT
jgi:hypothetical protein